MATTTIAYFDCSATTPVDEAVLAAMLPYFADVFGNASGAYSLGRRARGGLEAARAEVAAVLACRPAEVVFTSGGSESDNLALRGAAHALRAAGRGDHLVTSAIEHPAILATMRGLEAEGFAVTFVSVDAEGRVSPAAFLDAVRPDTALASLMLANNEVGTLQPLAEIASALRAQGIVVHTDAVQAAAYVDLSVDGLGVDLLSLSAHKFYGPKGAGALYVRDGTPISACQTGGSQEGSRRAGTENVAGAVGLARALSLAAAQRDAECARLAHLRERIKDALAILPGVRLTGHPVERLPGHVSLCAAGVRADVLLLGLDMRGIAASSGSACSNGKVSASHVLTAMGIGDEEAHGALRLSMGRCTSASDVDRLLDVLPGLIVRLQQAAAVAA